MFCVKEFDFVKLGIFVVRVGRFVEEVCLDYSYCGNCCFFRNVGWDVFRNSE